MLDDSKGVLVASAAHVHHHQVIVRPPLVTSGDLAADRVFALR